MVVILGWGWVRAAIISKCDYHDYYDFYDCDYDAQSPTFLFFSHLQRNAGHVLEFRLDGLGHVQGGGLTEGHRARGEGGSGSEERQKSED